MTKTTREMSDELDRILMILAGIPGESSEPRQSRAIVNAAFDAAELVFLKLIVDWLAKDMVPTRIGQGLMREVRTAIIDAKEKAGCLPEGAER